MGRHSLPDQYGAGGSDPRPRIRRRTVALATALVLTVAGGAAAAVRSGLLSFGSSCRDHPVRLTVAASPDVAPALMVAAKQAEDSGLTSDGQRLETGVTARESSKVAETLAAGKDPDAQVWVADSDLWVQRITANRKATRGRPRRGPRGGRPDSRGDGRLGPVGDRPLPDPHGDPEGDSGSRNPGQRGLAPSKGRHAP
ncbi:MULTISPECIES: substrate-binding domain-containing protein [Streptomyces]|uniref:substrate-binding domain-containing protein n=1 Tax=Streptomyces TaxID=1883 RepID=UPI0027E31A75|nr:MULTISPECIES: substrate-binding domain-containing protein [Streptomyces]